MSQFVESLARLYSQKQITQEMVRTLFTKGKITSSEFVYITSSKEKL